MNLNSDFRFNKAGQGCFYTGRISLDKNHFYFCYDCGSLSDIKMSINEEIMIFKKELKSNNNNTVDLLIISHFDSDHVNFVKKLCEGIKCGIAVIPYVEPLERLVLAIKTRDLSEDYNNFLLNPYNYLLELGFEKVIVIFRNGNENVLGDNEIPPEPDDILPTNEVYAKVNLKFISPKYFDEINDNESSFLNLKQYKNINFYSDEGYINIFYAWMLKFYAKQRPTEEKEKLNNFILSIINKEVNDKIFSDDILKLFDNLKIVREAYKNSFKGKDLMNSTSLLMLHRPFNNYHNIEMMMIEDNKHRTFLNKFNNNYSTLLTSDSNFLIDYNELTEHFSEEIDRIFICQVPHHGSRRSWEKKVIADLINCNIWIINYGIGNRYGHPALLVLYDLLNANKGNTIYMATEFTNFSYQLTLIYKK